MSIFVFLVASLLWHPAHRPEALPAQAELVQDAQRLDAASQVITGLVLLRVAGHARGTHAALVRLDKDVRTAQQLLARCNAGRCDAGRLRNAMDAVATSLSTARSADSVLEPR